MKWEITRKTKPEIGDIRYKTKFAFLPTRVLSMITMTDHLIWLQFYVEEQEYIDEYVYGEGLVRYWKTISKTIHI